MNKAAEKLDLNLPGGVVVVKIEAGFTDGDDLGISGEFVEPLEILIAHLLGIVGMHANRGIEPGEGFGQFQRRVIAGEVTGATHHNDFLYPHCPGLLDHLGDIGCKLWPLNVSVAINQTHADFGYHLTFAG
jgi:hypothetical protein